MVNLTALSESLTGIATVTILISVCFSFQICCSSSISHPDLTYFFSFFASLFYTPSYFLIFSPPCSSPLPCNATADRLHSLIQQLIWAYKFHKAPRSLSPRSPRGNHESVLQLEDGVRAGWGGWRKVEGWEGDRKRGGGSQPGECWRSQRTRRRRANAISHKLLMAIKREPISPYRISRINPSACWFFSGLGPLLHLICSPMLSANYHHSLCQIKLTCNEVILNRERETKQRLVIKNMERNGSTDKDTKRQIVIVRDSVQLCHTNPDL